LRENYREIVKYFLFFIVLAGAAFGGFQVLRSTLGTPYPIMVVVSESMVPTLGVGDFILIGHIDDFNDVVAEPMPEGDILVFLRSSSSDEYIVHRAIRSWLEDDDWWFTTKGDHNLVEDGRPVREGNVIGKVVGRIPIMGYFPLFIKTSKGFFLVAALMVLIFFADSLMPDKRLTEQGGSFPWFALIPFLVAPMIYVVFLFLPMNHVEVEFMALVFWYLGCAIAPLAFEDDDAGLMFWLYHFVLCMIPLGCDIVVWTTGITPSMWWNVKSSTVPITWLLQEETISYHRAFNQFALYILPGCILFLFLVYLKRRDYGPLVSFSQRLRSM